MIDRKHLSQEDEARCEEISSLKRQWGEQLIILTHHYQRAEVVAFHDFVGDSYQLAASARDAEAARYIVFCGVRFMAEAAEVLRRDSQVVIHPAPEAGCPLADYAPVEKADEAWQAISEIKGAEAVMPLVYMNSSVELKGMVGRNGGSVCTSSNAGRAFEWGLSQRQAVFFFPDEHLGRNTARGLGIEPGLCVVWDPDQANGGIEPDTLRQAKVILWKGHCHVHTDFTTEQIANARTKLPEAKIFVHPECRQEVVMAADGAGSTSYLVSQVEKATKGSTIIIGTEVNLVSRLAMEHPELKVIPLARSLCPNMFRISLKRLLDSLRSIPHPEVVKVNQADKQDAQLALTRMLSI